MLRQSRCLHRPRHLYSRRTTTFLVLWRRHRSSANEEPEWFAPLRAEMLNRETLVTTEALSLKFELKLSKSLAGFLPDKWNRPASPQYPVISPAHLPIWFNPAWPDRQLLPDGMDSAHSPGNPWVRRMWAGGSVHMKSDEFYARKSGFTVDSTLTGLERIKDVQLRGQNEAAKIFVTIERLFARKDVLLQNYEILNETTERADMSKAKEWFKKQVHEESGWGSAICKEERNLVFLKQRPMEEIEAIKAGRTLEIRYLNPPGTPDFAHKLTPTQALLFRFSALTFNAHLIHLDREYARNIEGHRNLLVHGPLTLTLLLHAITGHVKTQSEAKEAVEDIEYRNVAPLYCDEEMRICGREKKKLSNGSVYDVWIEGPTGGVAVKGIVHTFVKRLQPNPKKSLTHAVKHPGWQNSSIKHPRLGIGEQDIGAKEDSQKAALGGEKRLFRTVHVHNTAEKNDSGFTQRRARKKDTLDKHVSSEQAIDQTSVRIYSYDSNPRLRLILDPSEAPSEQHTGRVHQNRIRKYRSSPGSRLIRKSRSREPLRIAGLKVRRAAAEAVRVGQIRRHRERPQIRSVGSLKVRKYLLSSETQISRVNPRNRFMKNGIRRVGILRIRDVAEMPRVRMRRMNRMRIYT